MAIGDNIRRLRRERDITQEQLAELLGISSQAVSGWECGRTAPDISQIAPLASIFEVSSDVILGIDIKHKSRRIGQLYDEMYETACSGDHRTAIRLADDALKEFPDSHRLMSFFANEIYLYGHGIICDEWDRYSSRALGYLDILRTSDDSSLRNEAIVTTCLWYSCSGRKDEAAELAKSLEASQTSGELLARIYTGTKRFEVCRDEVVGQFVHAIGYMLDELTDCTYDGGKPVYSDDEKLKLGDMCIEMFRMLIPDGDYMFYAQYIECAARSNAYICAGHRDRERTLGYIRLAADMAVHFDGYVPNTPHTSPVLRGMKGEEIWWHDNHNRSYDLRNRLLMKDYEFLHGDSEFTAILDGLQKTAK